MTLAWDPVPEAAGYKLHYGETSGNYANTAVVGDATTHALTGLVENRNYCIVATAYDSTGTGESGYSNEVCATVAPAAPTADFSVSASSGAAPLTVTFTDKSSGEVTDRCWDFVVEDGGDCVDGGSGTGGQAVHTYSNAGNYTARMTVTGPGGTDSAQSSISVAVPTPVAAFSASPRSGQAPLTVSFSNASTGEITDYAWDFGDGAASTAANPSHTYARAGTYTVRLNASGPGGSDTHTKTNYITVTADDDGGGQQGDLYQQRHDSAGLVVMEAEWFSDILSQGNHDWIAVTDPDAYAGDAAMLSWPDDGSTIDDTYLSDSPRLDFTVNFVRSGTHYVWLRGLAGSYADNSAHVGVNGQAVSSADRIDFATSGEWSWTNDTMDNARARIDISAPGEYTINVWMRESGLRLDRVLLTSDANFVPSGVGPSVTWPDDINGSPCSAPCSLWDKTAKPGVISDPDTVAIEVGMRFRSAVSGTVMGIRFYKGRQNTGSHVGTLWSSNGKRLAQVTFTNETDSGWQEASFPTPVAINANTVYVISYHAPNGRYSIDEGYFKGEYTNGPLTALATADGGNGVYRYGGGGFPTETYNATNYWVDVVFKTPSKRAP